MKSLTTLNADSARDNGSHGSGICHEPQIVIGWRNQISDLTPLVNLTRLTGLYIGGNPISDINPLTYLTNLRRLGMRWNQITDIRILADLVNLTYLRLEGNPITDTSPLGNLPSLSDVDIEIPSLIPDANLRTAVHAALGIEPNLRITINAMRSLTTLNADSARDNRSHRSGICHESQIVIGWRESD